MTKSFILLAALVGMLVPSTASPRDATLLHFPVSETSQFVLLEPGSPVRSDATDLNSHPPDLNREFQFLGHLEPESIAPRRRIGELSIPHWMRSSRILDVPRRLQGKWPVGLTCTGMAYRPRADLHFDAQLRRKQHYSKIVAAACANGVPVALFDALIMQESRYRAEARSHAGAMGMAQLMPGTAADLGVSNAWDVEQNLDGGARYLRIQLDRFGEWRLALAAYNAGPGNVLKHGGVPPFRETRNYVRQILGSIETGSIAF